MALGANVGKVAVAFFVLANVALEAQRTYRLTGTRNFRVQRGGNITVTGYYKYCSKSIYCPSCVRQVYLNLFTRSVCLASLGPSDFDCKEHHFGKKFTALNTEGSYDIKMEETLAYKCVENRVSNRGGIFGTVLVQEPPSIVNKSSTPTVFTEDSLILYCSARGYPQPVVRWYKDDTFVHENTSLQFFSLNHSDTGLYMCNASNSAGSDTYEVQVLVREPKPFHFNSVKVTIIISTERRPTLQQSVLAHNTETLLQNDSVIFTVFLTHAFLSRDHAWNTVLVWILPHYARFLSHVPKTKITSPYPGEYQIGIGKIELASSMEINITVQIDPESKLSVGGHFMSIPSYVIYEKHIPGDASKVYAGSVESVTVNFTVREENDTSGGYYFLPKGTPRGFLMHPLSNEVYICKTKTSDSDSSCYFSTDGLKWTGIDPRVKFISGMIVRGLKKRIFARTSDDQCHVVSEDGYIWSCIVSDEWQSESSRDDFVHAISVPRNIKSDIPQDGFVFSKNDGSSSYGGSAKGLHKKENNGAWRLVALWDCP